MTCVRAIFARAGLAAVLGFGLLSAPAIAGKKDIQFDPGTDFSHVRGYQWRTHPVYEKNPGLQEKYHVAIQLVMEAGNAELAKRGLHAEDVSPDVYVTFYVLAHDAQEINIVTSSWGSGYGWYGAPSWTVTEVQDYLQGMLVIDIVDAATSKLLWRAHCGQDVKDMRERHKDISKAVRKALGNFPPKARKP
ncbi:MAG: DUF4136 domain-containing protein [Candidatus Solibacter sp.]